MENPATWGAAESVVAAAMRQADEGRQQGRVGLSTARQITDALREAGLLVESGLLDDEHELVSGSHSLTQSRPDFDAPPLNPPEQT